MRGIHILFLFWLYLIFHVSNIIQAQVFLFSPPYTQSQLQSLPVNVTQSIPLTSYGPYNPSPRSPHRFHIVDPTPIGLQGSISFLSQFPAYLPVGNLTYEIVLMSATDDPIGCRGAISGYDRSGQKLTGKAVIIYRGVCSPSVKGDNAKASPYPPALVLISGCNPAPPFNCNPTISNGQNGGLMTNSTIPLLYISSGDGFGVLTPALESGTKVYMYISGSDPAGTHPDDKQAMLDLATQTQWATGTNADIARIGLGLLYKMSDMADNPSLDPCLSGFTGIYCTGNRITSISYFRLGWKANIGNNLPTSFTKLSALQLLDITGSQFTSLPPQICSLTNLITLIIDQSTLLTSLPSCMNQLVNLRYISAIQTGLTLFPSMLLSSSPNIVYIDFTSSKLQDIPPGTINTYWPWLNVFIVSNNDISIANPSLLTDFKGLNYVQTIKLNGNRIKGELLPTSFDDCINLKTVDYSRNQFIGVVPNFNNTININYIDLSYQNYGLTGTVPSTFSAQLKKLNTLILAQNQLVSPLILVGCTALNYIDVSFNNLTSFTGISSQTGNFGQFLDSATTAITTVFKGDYNQFTGGISGSVLPGKWMSNNIV